MKKLESKIKSLECKLETEQEMVINQTIKKHNKPEKLKNMIDLHSLTKQEAMKVFTRWLNGVKTNLENQNNYRIRVKVITGKGNNSSKGPVIKPAIEDYLEQNDYDYEECSAGGAFKFWVVNDDYSDYDDYSD